MRITKSRIVGDTLVNFPNEASMGEKTYEVIVGGLRFFAREGTAVGVYTEHSFTSLPQECIGAVWNKKEFVDEVLNYLKAL